jgi:uncharacterized protein DUF6577
MNKKIKIENISNYFHHKNFFSTNEVYEYFKKIKPEIKRSTVRWFIYKLIQQGLLQRVGHGIYSLGEERKFITSLNNKQKEIAFRIKEQFPFITYCIWDTSVLTEFYRHLNINNFFIVEVEKDAVSALFYFLKESNKSTFKEPSKEIVEDFILNTETAVVVKPLISEAPLNIVDKIQVPSLEKILVDLYADKDLFYFLHGNELLNIFKSAFDKYTINSNRLFRYAKRRNKKDQIKNILDQIH